MVLGQILGYFREHGPWFKSSENEVKYIDLRRTIEIKKITNLMRYEIIYFMLE